MPFKTSRALLCLWFAGAFASAACASEQMNGFAPHRGVYEITLLRSAAGSGVADMTGRMVYELTGSACEGFTQNMRFVTRTTNGEGLETVNDLRTSSWEETGGKRLRFSSMQYQNDKIVDTTQGDGTRSKSDGHADVALERPEKKKVALPKDVHFPMQHAANLIAAARDGKKLFSAALYDGSEKGQKHYLTTAVIGKKFEPGAVANTVSLKHAERFQGLSSWPMSISYFDAGKDKEDSLPAYELNFRYFENGVTSDLQIDYGEFALKGELKELEMLPQSKCSAAAP